MVLDELRGIKPGLNVPTLLDNNCSSDNVGVLSIHTCSTFFVGRTFDKFSNIRLTKNAGKTYAKRSNIVGSTNVV